VLASFSIDQASRGLRYKGEGATLYTKVCAFHEAHTSVATAACLARLLLAYLDPRSIGVTEGGARKRFSKSRIGGSLATGGIAVDASKPSFGGVVQMEDLAGGNRNAGEVFASGFLFQNFLLHHFAIQSNVNLRRLNGLFGRSKQGSAWYKRGGRGVGDLFRHSRFVVSIADLFRCAPN
jgi:hypothetical protein